MLIDVHLRSASHSGHTFSRRFAGALRTGQRGRAGHSSSDSTSRSTKRHTIECAAAESHGLDILIHSVAVEPACREQAVATGPPGG